MSTNVTQNSAQSIMQTIKTTPQLQIADLDFVRDKFIQNYNACNKEKVGELMYHRNVIHMKQAISTNSSLASADQFSLYACFVTAAANGYSLDPQDNEVYLIARGGKACLDRQAGAHVKRLIRTGQIQYAEQAKLVYQGDEFEVESGRVVKHTERFNSDIIIAGYVKLIIDESGKDIFFIYRKSDWDSWKKKSPNPKTIEKKGNNNNTYISESLWDNGTIDGKQPEPNFLRTKIIKHATKEKCWAGGNSTLVVETYTEVEIDTEDSPNGQQFTARLKEHGLVNKLDPNIEPINPFADEDFAAPQQKNTAGVVVDDDAF